MLKPCHFSNPNCFFVWPNFNNYDASKLLKITVKFNSLMNLNFKQEINPQTNKKHLSLLMKTDSVNQNELIYPNVIFMITCKKAISVVLR